MSNNGCHFSLWKSSRLFTKAMCFSMRSMYFNLGIRYYFISRCNFKPSDISYDHLPRFYCDCLTAWSTINNKRTSSNSQVLDEILWNNQFLIIGDKPLFRKNLFAKGIVHISDILSDGGKLLSWDHFRGKGLNFNDYLLNFGLSKALFSSFSFKPQHSPKSLIVLDK